MSTKENPIYLVCGFPRSGTSMMMRCLEMGGIPAVYDERMDEREYPDPKYNPNPHGYYELTPQNEVHRVEHQGKAIKCLNKHLDMLSPMLRYRAVYMMRDPREIEQSYKRSSFHPHGRDLSRYDADTREDVIHLISFGIDVCVMMYSRVVAHPLVEFQRLKNFGWPINPNKAAQGVIPSLYRNRVLNPKELPSA